MYERCHQALGRMQDFMNLLPVPELTRADGGVLNLATHVPRVRNPSDLGPKCYFALGRPGEHAGGDSQTRLHLDMTDAINVMLHQPADQREANVRAGGAGGAARTTQPWQPPHYQVRLPRLGLQWREARTYRATELAPFGAACGCLITHLHNIAFQCARTTWHVSAVYV